MADLVEISYYDAVQAKTEAEAEEMHNKITRDYLDGNSIHWGIVDKSSDKIVGTCGFYRAFADGSGELGCILLPPFRGKGFMSDAMRLAIEFGTLEMKLKRIWAATSRENNQAINLLTKLNFFRSNIQNGDELQFELP